MSSKRKQMTTHYLLIISYLLLMVLFFLPDITIYAAATQSNAVSDIMNSTRFSGAIESIEWLTIQIDRWFTMIITGTAFFIISASMLKNTCAGAYCSNPKFWDAVASAHEKSEAVQLSQLFDMNGIKSKFAGLTTSSLKDMLLLIVPNIKAFTEFDDQDIEPKQYFTKAIPQMLACIIIGVFIYNGYYRDTAAVVGNFGSEICNRFFGSIDAANWVDKLTQTTSKAECIYDNDTTEEGKFAAQLSQAIYKAYLGKAKGLTSRDAKDALMRDAEDIADNKIIRGTTSTESGDKEAFMVKHVNSDSRRYDYTMGNLKITPVPKQSYPNLNSLSCTVVDEATKSKYSYHGYFDAPASLASSDYIDNSTSGCFYVSFVMTGSQKTASAGASLLKAVAGIGSSVNQITGAVSVSGSGGKAPQEGAFGEAIKAQYKNQVESAALSKIKEMFPDDTATAGTIEWTTLPAGNTIVTWKGTHTYSCTARVHVNLNQNGSTTTQTVIVPLKIEASIANEK